MKFHEIAWNFLDNREFVVNEIPPECFPAFWPQWGGAGAPGGGVFTVPSLLDFHHLVRDAELRRLRFIQTWCWWKNENGNKHFPATAILLLLLLLPPASCLLGVVLGVAQDGVARCTPWQIYLSIVLWYTQLLQMIQTQMWCYFIYLSFFFSSFVKKYLGNLGLYIF